MGQKLLYTPAKYTALRLNTQEYKVPIDMPRTSANLINQIAYLETSVAEIL